MSPHVTERPRLSMLLDTEKTLSSKAQCVLFTNRVTEPHRAKVPIPILGPYHYHHIYTCKSSKHDDVIKCKHCPRYWPFVWGIHRSLWIPHTKASDAELWCFFYLRLNKRWGKQWWGWWFETLSRPLWRHRNEYQSLFDAYSRTRTQSMWGDVTKRGFPLKLERQWDKP